MKVYLDSCVFIVYVEKEVSNSRIIIELAERGLFSVVISSHTIYEVIHNLKRQHSKDIAGYMFSLFYVFPNLEIVSAEEITAYQKEHHYSIKDKDDLPHVIAYLLSGSDYFVTTNRRLAQMEMPEIIEFVTPREFIEAVLNIRGFDIYY